MRKWLAAVWLSLVSVPALAGCDGQHAAPAAALGTVAGTLVRVGGPAPGAAVPLRGQVVALNAAGVRIAAAVGRSGRYRLALPPGTYQLSGHSPLVHVNGAEMLCTAARAVHITAGQTRSGVTVICSIR
jgi:hypothetical protein